MKRQRNIRVGKRKARVQEPAPLREKKLYCVYEPTTKDFLFGYGDERLAFEYLEGLHPDLRRCYLVVVMRYIPVDRTIGGVPAICGNCRSTELESIDGKWYICETCRMIRYFNGFVPGNRDAAAQRFHAHGMPVFQGDFIQFAGILYVVIIGGVIESLIEAVRLGVITPVENREYDIPERTRYWPHGMDGEVAVVLHSTRTNPVNAERGTIEFYNMGCDVPCHCGTANLVPTSSQHHWHCLNCGIQLARIT